MKRLFSLGFVALGLLAVPVISRAATISWNTATNMAGDSDVENNGAAFDAGTFYGTTTTVNGVTFHPLTNSSGTFSDVSIGGKISVTPGTVLGPTGSYTKYTGGSSDYQNVVSTLLYTSSGIGNGPTITLSGLTLGDVYQVEVWAYDGKVSDDGKITTQLSGTTAPNGLINGSVFSTTPETGQYLTGSFTAVSSNLSFQALQTQNYAVISDISVRDLTVAPEPSQGSLLVVGVAFLAAIYRCRPLAVR